MTAPHHPTPAEVAPWLAEALGKLVRARVAATDPPEAVADDPLYLEGMAALYAWEEARP